MRGRHLLGYFPYSRPLGLKANITQLERLRELE
jgi:hypothetical protein